MNRFHTAFAGLAFGVFALAPQAQAEDPVATEGAEVGKWTMDYEAAAALAAEKKLPILINFTGSDWCGWCKLMDKNVFAEEQWKTFAAENVVLATIDFPRDKTIVPEKFVEQNKALKEKFGIRGYPTYIVLDHDAETQIGKLGAGRDKTPESFITEFKALMRKSASGIQAYIEANPEKAEAYKAAIEEEKAANKALADWLETKPERNEENNAKFAELSERIKAATEKLGEF